MRPGHALAQLGHVPCLASLHAGLDAVIFRDDVVSTPMLVGTQGACVLLQEILVDIPEVRDGIIPRLLPKDILRREAILSKFVVLSINKLVGGVGVGKNKMSS